MMARLTLGRLAPAHIVAALLLAVMVLFIVGVPLLPSYDPYGQNLAFGLADLWERSPEGHLAILGTDTLGRDVLSRMALAGRISVLISVGAVLFSLVFGVLLGLIAGYFGGILEQVIVGFADLQLSIPRILLLVAVTAMIGPGSWKLALLLGATSWVSYGRVARAMALSLRTREFVLSAITQGATATWNIRTHLLPNVLPQMLIVGSYEFSQIIIIESSLSYLGLGVQPPLPSWGMMVADGQNYLALSPWLCLLPSIALILLIAGLQILSQAFTAEGGPAARPTP
jgi:peptide/nickel transport system permease protein